MCEIVWVLESSYNYKREQVAETLKLILETGNFIVEKLVRTWCALEAYQVQNMDFSDALLGETNQLYGCKTTVTLDKKAAKMDSFYLLEDNDK